MGYWSSLLGLPSNQAANQAREIPNPIFLFLLRPKQKKLPGLRPMYKTNGIS
jgi:hypothetical protein